MAQATAIVRRDDIDALCHRLVAGARSVVPNDMPDRQADLLIAAKLLRALLRDSAISDPIAIEIRATVVRS
jgi:hypothetical protein